MLAAVLALALAIGTIVGLLGGGGSVLTVPVFTYVAGWPAKAAIAASLLVVALTSAAGALTHARAGRVEVRTGLGFAAAGMVGALVGGRLARGVSGHVLMVCFAAMMLATAVAMLRGRRTAAPPRPRLPLAVALGLGLAVGALTGFVGAGGGFLVVPVLVLGAGLAVERAIGTSLLVIACTSAAGFLERLDHVAIDWPWTLAVSALSVLGAIVGGRLAGRIAPATLRRAFGLLVLAMAVLVLIEEFA
jgi:uncharacterized membrane protein YfcA